MIEIIYPDTIEISSKGSFPKKELISPGTVLVNDKGLYGDFVVKKYDDGNFLIYPELVYLQKNISSLIEKKPIIVLLNSQMDEINFLKDIFIQKRIELDSYLLLEGLGLRLEWSDVVNLAKTNPYYRIIYFVIKYNFNPSYLFLIEKDNILFSYTSDLRKLKLKFCLEYLENFDHVVLDLAYIDDLMQDGGDLESIMTSNHFYQETRDWLIENNKINKNWIFEYL